MKLNSIEVFSRLQRILYKLHYGDWYVQNEVYLHQFLSLRQGDLTVAEYEYEFARLQYLCQLVEDVGYDLISFLRGLRPDILKRMNE